MGKLANVFWHALTGSHAHLASGEGGARRYAAGFPAIIAFENPAKPDFRALRRFCEPGDRFYCGEWDGPAPAGWTIEMDTRMCAMLWAAATPRAFASDDVVRLDSAHVPQMLALAGATKPGPYAQRPLEIGEWYGILDNDQVVAMAGERAHAGELREVSGVCTMPGYQGRGYAKRLTEHVIRSQLARGFTPFLHVASANLRARALYERMGFVVDQEIPLRIVELRE